MSRRLIPVTKNQIRPLSLEVDSVAVERIGRTQQALLRNQFEANKIPRGRFKMTTQSRNALSSRMVNAPAARGTQIRSANKPKMTSGRMGVVVSHKEMIGSLFSAATTLTYSATAFTVNPGKADTFPWLSTIALNFDKYRILSMVVHLVSNQPTSTAGRIGLGLDYDSTDPLPADRIEFFNLTHHVESSPWDSLTLNLPFESEIKFVNSHTITDSKLIDMGAIIVMSDQIVATNTAIADIIVEYKVELIEAQQAPMLTMIASAANPVAFSSLNIVGPVIAELVPTSSTTVVEFLLPAGAYLVNAYVYDSSAGLPTIATAVNGGTGFSSNGLFNITGSQTIAQTKITSNTGKIRFTIGVVTIANLENISFVFTRVSPAEYAGYLLLTTGLTALTTY